MISHRPPFLPAPDAAHTAAGLYALDRAAHPASFLAAKERMHAAFEWDATPPHCPPPLRGRLHGPLHAGDLCAVGGQLACQQAELAADGHLMISMLGDLSGALGGAGEGAWEYRRLHVEAGVVGHALYLEAEAQGVRGSGLGCFFDDEVHRLVGLPDARFQALYSFACGVPMSDERLQGEDPYARLRAKGR